MPSNLPRRTSSPAGTISRRTSCSKRSPHSPGGAISVLPDEDSPPSLFAARQNRRAVPRMVQIHIATSRASLAPWLGQQPHPSSRRPVRLPATRSLQPPKTQTQRLSSLDPRRPLNSRILEQAQPWHLAKNPSLQLFREGKATRGGRQRWLDAAWRVAPMQKDERAMGRRMLKRAAVQGYLLADANFDSNELHDVCLERGVQLVAPPRYGFGRRRGHRRQSPARLRSLDALESAKLVRPCPPSRT